MEPESGRPAAAIRASASAHSRRPRPKVEMAELGGKRKFAGHIPWDKGAP